MLSWQPSCRKGTYHRRPWNHSPIRDDIPVVGRIASSCLMICPLIGNNYVGHFNRYSFTEAAKKMGYLAMTPQQLGVAVAFIEGRGLLQFYCIGKSLCYACLPVAFYKHANKKLLPSCPIYQGIKCRSHILLYWSLWLRTVNCKRLRYHVPGELL